MKKFWMTILGWFIRTVIIAAGTIATGFALYGVFYAIELASEKLISFLLRAWQLVCANLVISIGIAMLIALVWCIADYLMRIATPWWDRMKAKRDAKRKEKA